MLTPWALRVLDVADRGAVDALHDHDVRAGQLPVHLRDIQGLAAQPVAPQLRGVGRFALEVELVEDGLLVLRHHLHRAQALALLPVALGQVGDDVEEPDVPADDLVDPRAQDLDHHLAAVLEAGGVDLGDRGRRQGGFVESVEDRRHRATQGLLDEGACLGPGEGRDPVLELGQLDREVVREQVAAGGEDLAELDEDGPEVLQGAADAHRVGLGVAPEPEPGGEVGQETQGAKQVGRQDHLVQPVAEQDPVDVEQAQRIGGADHAPPSASARGRRRARRSTRAARRSTSSRRVSTRSRKARTS